MTIQEECPQVSYMGNRETVACPGRAVAGNALAIIPRYR
jgi:hypothetical protein